MNLRSILLSKKSILKSYKLYNSIYVTFSDNILMMIENAPMVSGCKKWEEDVLILYVLKFIELYNKKRKKPIFHSNHLNARILQGKNLYFQK